MTKGYDHWTRRAKILFPLSGANLRHPVADTRQVSGGRRVLGDGAIGYRRGGGYTSDVRRESRDRRRLNAQAKVLTTYTVGE